MQAEDIKFLSMRLCKKKYSWSKIPIASFLFLFSCLPAGTAFFFFLLPAYSQNQVRIDRTKMFLGNTKNDSVRCELLIDLVQEYTGISPDTALAYNEKALEIATALNDKKLLSRCYHSFGNIYYYKGDYADALNNYFKSLKLNEELGDKKAIASSFNNIGNVYWLQGKNEEALEFYFKDLEVSEELGDKINEAKTLGNIGLIYDAKKEYDKALDYYFKSAELSEKIKDYDATANAYINIGLVMQIQEKFEEALSYYEKAKNIAESMGSKEALTLVTINTGSCYKDMKKYALAESYLKKALILSSEIGSKYYLKYIYDLLAELSKEQNDYKSSVEYYELLLKVKDSIYNEESSKQLNELQTRYDTEKKQKQIEIQNLELKEKQIVIYAVSGGLVLMFLLVFVIYRGYKQKQKINRELQAKNTTILRQKDEIEEQKFMIEEKNKDITDSIEYAKTLQDAILPDIETVMHSLPNSFIFFRPRDIVSGDFYWYHRKENRHFIIAADCTGHGVPGAFVSMVCNNLLNEVIIHKNMSDPGKILTEVNKSVFSVFQKEGTKARANDGMDISLCIFDSETRLLEFAGAMNPAILVRNNIIIELPADKISIGGSARPGHRFSAMQTELQKDDCIYIFSDGFHDQFGGNKGKKFMFRNFKKLLSEVSLLSAADQVKQLDTELLSWQGNYERVDDILVIGFKVA